MDVGLQWMLCVLQVETSATRRSLVQRSPTVCVCVCHPLHLQWAGWRDQTKTIFHPRLLNGHFPNCFIIKITCKFLVYYITYDRSLGAGGGTLHSSQFWSAPKIFLLNCLWKEMPGRSSKIHWDIAFPKQCTGHKEGKRLHVSHWCPWN